ncbi:MAG: hypothetical protein JKX94_02420 [Sneathiella sp.]|nr:hypothetical protein [Sneathiella sp.]
MTTIVSQKLFEKMQNTQVDAREKAVNSVANLFANQIIISKEEVGGKRLSDDEKQIIQEDFRKDFEIQR